MAPTDWRMPISRVRSVTLTSMIFMMPMPPTMSETPATQASSERKAAVVDSWVLMMSCWVVMVKSAVSQRDVVPLGQQQFDLLDDVVQVGGRVHLDVDHADPVPDEAGEHRRRELLEDHADGQCRTRES